MSNHPIQHNSHTWIWCVVSAWKAGLNWGLCNALDTCNGTWDWTTKTEQSKVKLFIVLWKHVMQIQNETPILSCILWKIFKTLYSTKLFKIKTLSYRDNVTGHTLVLYRSEANRGLGVHTEQMHVLSRASSLSRSTKFWPSNKPWSFCDQGLSGLRAFKRSRSLF